VWRVGPEFCLGIAYRFILGVMKQFARQLLVWWMMLAVPAHALAADVMGYARASDSVQSMALEPVMAEHEGCAMHTDPATCLACTVCATAASLIGTLTLNPIAMVITRARFELGASPSVVYITDGLERPPRTSLI
jgi:hypothetical protein